MGMADSTWSEVPLDLINLLARRMNLCDLVRLGAVCTSWRCFLNKDTHWLGYGPQIEALSISPISIPKLMLNEGGSSHSSNNIIINDSNTRGFVDLTTGRTLQLHLPEAAGRRICGAGNGWVVTVGEDMEIHLLNPITRERLRLPSQLSFRKYGPQYEGLGETREEERDRFILKAIVIGSPGTADCAVAAIICPRAWSRVALARPGLDESWTVLKSGCDLGDIIHIKGLLYGVCLQIRHGLHVWDMTNPDTYSGAYLQPMSLVRILHPEPWRWIAEANDFYLVEVSGELMAVIRTFTSRIVVFRVEKGRQWVEVSDLGGCCLLLGNNASITLSPVPSGLEKNCIYFTSRFVDKRFHCEGSPDYLGVYCLDDGRYRPFYPSKKSHDNPNSPPLWVLLNPTSSAMMS